MFLLDNTLERIKDMIEQHISNTSTLGEHSSRDIKDSLLNNNPEYDDSIGDLTYKLNCVCIMMWENQEFLYAVRKMSTEEFISTYGGDLSNLHNLVKRCCDLNYQRSLLMDAIDKKATEISNAKTVGQ